jgi:hypothetical protein
MLSGVPKQSRSSHKLQGTYQMTTSTWTPAVRLDLDTASPQSLEETLTAFADWSKATPIPPLAMQSGWHTITPEISQDLLRRYRVNRKPSLKYITKYAAAMLAEDWKRTGQAILINQESEVEDGYHRLLASYFSGASFPSYVVSDVPVDKKLFVYIDDNRARNAADAIYTAGNNGLSAVIAAAVKIAWRYDNKAFALSRQPRLRDITNPEVLDYVQSHPGLGEAAHILMGTYSKAVKVLSNKAVAVFFAWKASEQHGFSALNDFLTSVASGANLDETNPILALRDRFFGIDESDEALKVPHRLALLIKTFNMHVVGKKLGKTGLVLADNEKFPRFEDVKPMAEAA